MSDQKCNLLKLCENLIETYNATFLSKAPNELQQACYNEAQVCLGLEKNLTHDKKYRNVLAQLINNHYNATKPEVEFIGGPATLTCHFSETYKKLIYIFGEEHSTITDCEKIKHNQKGELIENYLGNLVANTNCFLDIFIEIPGYKGLKYKNSLGEHIYSALRLYQIGNHFENCINASTRNKNILCDLSRIHYFDIRNFQGEEGPDPISDFIFKYFSTGANLKIGDFDIYIDQLITVAVTYSSIMNGFLIDPKDTDNFKNFWLSQLRLNKYVVKELDRAGDFSELIKTFIEKEILASAKEYGPELRDFTNRVLHNISIWPRNKIHDQNLIVDFENMIDAVIIPNSRVADAYTLARIFKKFKIDTTNLDKKRHTDEPEEAHNIIIYAGDYHSDIYRKFLGEVLKFTPIAKIGKINIEENMNPKHCINMKEADVKSNMFFSGWSIQPLFSAWPPVQQPNIEKINEKKNRSICSVMNCSKELSYINKIDLSYLRLDSTRVTEEMINQVRSIIQQNVTFLKHYQDILRFEDEKEKDIINKNIKEKEKREDKANEDRNEREAKQFEYGKAPEKSKIKNNRRNPY
jgi:hypothetical protein